MAQVQIIHAARLGTYRVQLVIFVTSHPEKYFPRIEKKKNQQK